MNNMEQARFNMVEQQIRPWDVLNAEVLDLLRRYNANSSFRRVNVLWHSWIWISLWDMAQKCGNPSWRRVPCKH